MFDAFNARDDDGAPMPDAPAPDEPKIIDLPAAAPPAAPRAARPLTYLQRCITLRLI